MGHIAVAVPASQSLSTLGHHVVDAPGLDKLLVELGVAADAVVHDDTCRSIFGHDGLPLGMGHEVGHVLHAVHPLEKILHGNVLVGHMAIVACRVAAMRGVRPSGIVGGHDVAVDASSGVITYYIILLSGKTQKSINILPEAP